MGTKLTELRDGCFHRAMDDEPMFVLLARDPLAAELVRLWADRRESQIIRGKRPASDVAQVNEARDCALKMEQWREDNDGAWRGGLFVFTNNIQVINHHDAAEVTMKPNDIP